jgi:hypothetical protein
METILARAQQTRHSLRQNGRFVVRDMIEEPARRAEE